MKHESKNGLLTCARQLTETIRNDVNLKKQTLRLIKSPEEPSKYRLDFMFDAAAECTVSIWYLAEEKTDASNNTLAFETQYPIQPVTTKFPAALGHRYVQTLEYAFDVAQVQVCRVRCFAATGLVWLWSVPHLRLSAYVMATGAISGVDSVAEHAAALRARRERGKSDGERACAGQNRGQMYYHQGSQFFPIVIMLQTCETNPNRVQSQSTFATFKSNGDGTLSAAVVKQKIQVQGNAYELQEIFGIDQGQNDAENSKECVICMSAPKDTTVLPCRHMCMCSDCAKVLRYQTNKCPICRCAVESLLQIQVNQPGQDDSNPNP